MNWMFYLKTTETCQLNCKHCFTSGINGKKIYFDHFKTIDFIKRFRQYFNKNEDTIHKTKSLILNLEQMQEIEIINMIENNKDKFLSKTYCNNENIIIENYNKTILDFVVDNN
jgi:transcription elongation factor